MDAGGALQSEATKEHIWIPSKCPQGVTKKSSTSQLDLKQDLNCGVEQLFPAELPALSALKEINNSSNTFCRYKVRIKYKVSLCCKILNY